MALGSILNPILGWTLNFSPLSVILGTTIIVNLLIMLLYKFATNQEELKRIKERLTKLQKEVRKHAQDRKKLQKIQQEMAQLQMNYMRHSLRMTLYTFIPLILLFSWFNLHYLYAPITPGGNFTITFKSQNLDINKIRIESEGFKLGKIYEDQGVVKAILNAPELEGIYEINISYDDKQISSFKLGVGTFYNEAKKIMKVEEPVKEIELSIERYHPFGENFKIFGWKPGWIGTYIIFSIVFSSIFRKLLNVY